LQLLADKVAIVTGAGRGVGRAEALALAEQGAKVVVNDLGVSLKGEAGDTPVAEIVAREIREAGGQAAANRSDISTQDGVESLLGAASSRFGGLDILVNNAGLLRDKSLLKMSQEDWDLVQKVHGKGMFLCTSAAGRLMKEQGRGGVIINTTSVSGLAGMFGQANYGFAKAGTYAFTKIAAMELARYNIRVHAVAPNAITRMTQELPGLAGVSSEALTPEATARLVVYLASDLAEELTGRVVALQGGIQGSQAFEFKMNASPGFFFEHGLPSEEEIADNLESILFNTPDLEASQVLAIKS